MFSVALIAFPKIQADPQLTSTEIVRIEQGKLARRQCRAPVSLDRLFLWIWDRRGIATLTLKRSYVHCQYILKSLANVSNANQSTHDLCGIIRLQHGHNLPSELWPLVREIMKQNRIFKCSLQSQSVAENVRNFDKTFYRSHNPRTVSQWEQKLLFQQSVLWWSSSHPRSKAGY